MSVDLTEFLELAAPKRPPCPLGVALANLKPAERDQLKAALAQDKSIINAGAIEQWLARRGVKTSVQHIATHRRGRCACDG